MRYKAAFWILLSLALLLTLWATPASAGLDTWYFGTGFNVGGVFFRVGYAEAGPFGSSFYFEAAQPFSYRGYGCSSFCYRRGPRYYHHPSCSAVHRHFGHHGYAPAYFIQHYGPPLPYRPPVQYYSPQRWRVYDYGYDGHYNRHRQDRYYRDKHGRHNYHPGRGDRHRNDRWRSDRGRHERDRHNRGSFKRD